jgi:hypothetical protein
MNTYLDTLLSNPDYEKMTVEYYPHIQLHYDANKLYAGSLVNETNIKFPIENVNQVEYTEYTHNEKHLKVYDGEQKKREFIHIVQVDNKIQDGLYVVSKYEYIDPNKFPIMNKYHDIKYIKSQCLSHKGIDIFLIEQRTASNSTDSLKYIKLSMVIPSNEHMKKKFKKEFTVACSLVSQMQSQV